MEKQVRTQPLEQTRSAVLAELEGHPGALRAARAASPVAGQAEARSFTFSGFTPLASAESARLLRARPAWPKGPRQNAWPAWGAAVGPASGADQPGHPGLRPDAGEGLGQIEQAAWDAALLSQDLALRGLLKRGGLRRCLAFPHPALKASRAAALLRRPDVGQALRAKTLCADPEVQRPAPDWCGRARVGFPASLPVDSDDTVGRIEVEADGGRRLETRAGRASKILNLSADYGKRSVPCPLSALAECFNARCAAHRAAIPQARRNFEAAFLAEVTGPSGPIARAARKRAEALPLPGTSEDSGAQRPAAPAAAPGGRGSLGYPGEPEVAAGCLRLTALGAGLAYQEFRLLQLLRHQGVRISRFVLIDRLYAPVAAAVDDEEPPAELHLRDGIFQELGSWDSIKREVAKALQQITDFLEQDGTEVFALSHLHDYEALCGDASPVADDWRCDLLVQVDAGELKDGMTSQQKARMLRPGGLHCVLWAMTAHTPEEEGLDKTEHPLRFCFTRMERRLNDWVAGSRCKSQKDFKEAGPDPRVQLVRQWRTYRTATQQKLHEAFLRELEEENQEYLKEVKEQNPEVSEATIRELERELRRH